MTAKRSTRKCIRCGERKPAVVFPGCKRDPSKRGRFCEGCIEAEAYEMNHKPPRRRRRCATWPREDGVIVRACAEQDCEVVLPLETGYYVSTRDAVGEPTEYGRYCRRCSDRRADRRMKERKRNPAEAGQLRAAHAAEQRERRKDPEKRAKMKAAQKRYRERVLADPEKHAKQLEANRMARRLRREREGRPITRRSPKVAMPSEPHLQRLPAAPLLVVVDRLVVETGTTEREMERWLGVSQRTFDRWREDPAAQVKQDTADRVLTAARLNWHDVFEAEVVAMVTA